MDLVLVPLLVVRRGDGELRHWVLTLARVSECSLWMVPVLIPEFLSFPLNGEVLAEDACKRETWINFFDKPDSDSVTKILWATTRPSPITFGLVTIDYESGLLLKSF